MLESLSIQGVVLIDRLELKFGSGFTVLTGETGAGKSILLDALGLALGERANTQLVNPRHKSASVCAVFSVSSDHPVHHLLSEHGLDDGDVLILRRVVSFDGKSRAYINDQTVSLGLLKSVGSQLVEIHGQFDHLLDPGSHLHSMDRFARTNEIKKQVQQAFSTWKEAENLFREAHVRQGRDTEEHDFLLRSREELKALDPRENEEESLKSERAYLLNHARIAELLHSLSARLYEDRGAEILLRDAVRSASRLAEIAPNHFHELAEGLERARMEVDEVRSVIEHAMGDSELDGQNLENVEERLHKLRSVARKHGVEIKELPLVLADIEKKLETTNDQAGIIQDLDENRKIARENFITLAHKLREMRTQAKTLFEETIRNELVDLRLDKAEVQVALEELPENAWNESGMDRAEFMIQPNPGMPLGPLSKIASGGERSRFMLALKVILADNPFVSLLIFDEIDAGVGGAVAAAIGERMARLGQEMQVLAITHAPQVAAAAREHLLVSKRSVQGTTLTDVRLLSAAQREEEVGRMLAGEEITPEARAAAIRLLEPLHNRGED